MVIAGKCVWGGRNTVKEEKGKKIYHYKLLNLTSGGGTVLQLSCKDSANKKMLTYVLLCPGDFYTAVSTC